MALLPALLLALLAGWAGTLPGAASYPAGAIGQAALLAAVALAGGLAFDPLVLGRRARWLLAPLALAILASWIASPVPRAGRTALVLLPAFVALPAVVRRAWRDAAARRAGLVAWALVVAALGVLALVEQAADRSPRAAMPLGHHNLLALVLVAAAPIAAAALAERAWLPRIAGGAALASAALALVATRSFLGAAGAALALGLFGWRSRRAGQFLLGLALLAAAALVPRAERILSGTDASFDARAVYWRAGWRGFLARPWTGWGPGSTPWTIAQHLSPVPGVSPPGEVVGELHSLPLALAYELGAPAAILSLAVVARFLARRVRGLDAAAAPALAAGGLAGFAGAGVLFLGSAALAVPAIGATWALAVGAALAGEGAGEHGPPARRRSLATWVYVALATLALIRPTIAWSHYERARGAADRAARQSELASAVALDPGFPLYRARWSWVAAVPPAERAEAAYAAARAAPGVAALWLRAGTLGTEAGSPWTGEALGRAMALDPLGPMAPYWLATTGLGPVAGCAARAVAAEPRLAAAAFWRGRESALEKAATRLDRWPGIDAGWRLATVATLRRAAAVELPADAPLVDLGLTADGNPASSLSLFAFRRAPWPIDLVRVPLGQPRLAGIREPAAARLPTSAASAFPAEACVPAGEAGKPAKN